MLRQVQQVFLEIVPAKQLARSQNELFALLQGLTAHTANEAGQVENEVLGAHHHVIGLDTIAAS